jgi:hypothetical protein
MNTIYELIANREISFAYLESHKLHILFSPILNIRDIQRNELAEILEGEEVDEFTFSDKDKLDMVKFVVNVFSKESTFQKIGIQLFSVIDDVCKELDMRKELKERIRAYKIKELSEVVDEFLIREDPEHRTLMTAKILHDEFLSTCTMPVKKSNGEVDYETKKYLFDESLKLQNKIYELDQSGKKDNLTFHKMAAEHKEKRSLNSEDML